MVRNHQLGVPINPACQKVIPNRARSGALPSQRPTRTDLKQTTWRCAIGDPSANDALINLTTVLITR